MGIVEHMRGTERGTRAERRSDYAAIISHWKSFTFPTKPLRTTGFGLHSKRLPLAVVLSRQFPGLGQKPRDK